MCLLTAPKRWGGGGGGGGGVAQFSVGTRTYSFGLEV